jgi:hypothetical protein
MSSNRAVGVDFVQKIPFRSLSKSHHRFLGAFSDEMGCLFLCWLLALQVFESLSLPGFEAATVLLFDSFARIRILSIRSILRCQLPVREYSLCSRCVGRFASGDRVDCTTATRPPP